MLTRLIPLVLAALMLAFFSGIGGCDKKAAEIQAADEQYDNCLDADDGAGAVRYVSKDSLARLDRLIAIARTAKKADVKALPLPDMQEVLQMRVLLGSELLKPIDGRTYYIKLVSKGWVNSTSLLERVKIKVDSVGTSATVTYRDPDDKETTYGHWIFEDGSWKEDQIADLQNPQMDLKAAAKEARMTEEELLLTGLGARTGETVLTTVWDPPKK